MITYEAALAKAKLLKPNIDNGAEYPAAYVFGSHEDDNTFGGDGPVAILKKDGRAINMIAFIEDYGGEIIREFEL